LELDPGDGEPRLTREGPLLITHWGLSGPAILKLSAFGALRLYKSGYKAELRVNFLGGMREDQALKLLMECKIAHPKRTVMGHRPFEQLSRRFWQRALEVAQVSDSLTYADAPKTTFVRLAQELTGGLYSVDGKGVFKEEFVTAGGISLSEVNFKTMASQLVPGLHFAGEVLDIDGITGGFNFQAAWTTSFLAAQAMVLRP
jgi:predicted Rossmann fold flavoprotein